MLLLNKLRPDILALCAAYSLAHILNDGSVSFEEHLWILCLQGEATLWNPHLEKCAVVEQCRPYIIDILY